MVQDGSTKKPAAAKAVPPSAPASAAPPQAAKVAPAPKAASSNAFVSQLMGFLKEDVDLRRLRKDESDFYPKHKNLVHLVIRQSYAIVILVILIIVGSIFLQPIYTYSARTPERNLRPLIALTEPNQTDQAVLSWVVSSITEILTFGFGDIDQKIMAQQNRFTPEGWDSFIGTIRERGLRSDFKMNQMVLTTVPSNVPVIVAKGLDDDNDYTWVVELPIIMTYSTNNNRQKVDKSIIRVTIARMPSIKNRAGIGIKVWKKLQ